MKKKDLIKLISDYREFFPAEWVFDKRTRSYMRRSGSWVQYISFHNSVHSDRYRTVNCFDYLKRQGELTGGILPTFLLHPALLAPESLVEKWIRPEEHHENYRDFFSKMVDQFRPNILRPFSEDNIITLLNEQADSWHHVYILFIIYVDRGDKAAAEKYYNLYIQGPNINIPPDFDKVKKEMEEYLRLMDTDMQKLRDKFKEIQDLHLKEFNGLL